MPRFGVTTCSPRTTTAGMKKITRHSASAALELLPDGVLVVRLAGPLTRAALMTVKAGIVADYPPDAIRAFVADYTAAIIALTGDELDGVLEGEQYAAAASRPAALIVTPPTERLFIGHCVRMAEHGIIRQVFSEEAPALRWASRHARRLRTRT